MGLPPSFVITQMCYFGQSTALDSVYVRNFIFWSITPDTPVKSQPTLGKNIWPLSSRLKNEAFSCCTFHDSFLFACSSTLKTEATSSETWVDFQGSIRSYFARDGVVHNHLWESLRCYISTCWFQFDSNFGLLNILWNPKVPYLVYKNPILSQMYPLHSTALCLQNSLDIQLIICIIRY
jgi:hypothetical protein